MNVVKTLKVILLLVIKMILLLHSGLLKELS